MSEQVEFRVALREALDEELGADETVILFGEDVAQAGGVFAVTTGLFEKYGPARVFDTPISELAMTGAAFGAAVNGMRPVLEIMFGDFLGLSMDSLINQASKYWFLTGERQSVPLVIRSVVGAGGRFGAIHSQMPISWLMGVPGLKIVAPSTPAAAKSLLRAAIQDPNPVLFFEHKRLYNKKGPLNGSVGEIGVAYASVALGASGGVPPYKWSIATGSLPPGLALSSAGNASGKPTATGSYSFAVRVDDSAGAAAGVSRTITVVPHLSASGVCTKECDVEQGCVTVCGKFGSQTGGLAPYRYKVSVGVLPSGMALSGLALAGAFPVASNCGECRPLWQFSVTLSDALGATDAVNAIFYVFPHISISGPGAICSGFGCTTQVFYTSYDGSTPTVAITNVVCDAVDPGCQDPTTISGFSATSSGGTFGTITITFPGGEWVGTFDITIADQSSCGPSAICLSNTVTQAANVNAG